MSTDKTLADVQPGGRVRLGDGWTGWATQYPNKMPKLCGAREIAELNHYPEEGQRLLFLAENPVHVGDLVDAARAALPFVAFAYSKGVAGAEEAGRAIEAALSAQPSPGGQDALAALQQDYDKLLDSFNRQVEVAEKIAGRALQQDDRIEELEEALAARQPVGEPVAYTDGNEFVCAAEYATMRGLGHDGNGWRPLYAAPPAQAVSQDWQHIANEWADAATNGVQWLRNIRDGASTVADALACMESNVERIQQLKPPAQAVDLGQFIALAKFGEEFAFSAEKQPHSRVIYSQASRLLALIDGKAVGK